MKLSKFADLTGSIESIFTIGALIVGALWALRLYRNQRENVPWIEFTADIVILGKQGTDWIIELIANIENKGKVQHRLDGPKFELAALNATDPLVAKAEFGGQTWFPRELLKGTFLPKGSTYFFIEPGVSAKYSYITHVPDTTSFLMLHARFEYPGGRHAHTAERTIKV